jgi:hypothetical protein
MELIQQQAVFRLKRKWNDITERDISRIGSVDERLIDLVNIHIGGRLLRADLVNWSPDTIG